MLYRLHHGRPCPVLIREASTVYLRASNKYKVRIKYDGFGVDERVCGTADEAEALLDEALTDYLGAGGFTAPVAVLPRVQRGGGGAKLTVDEARAIFRDPRCGVEVAKDYGVCAMTVSLIRRGVTWRHAIAASPRRAVCSPPDGG